MEIDDNALLLTYSARPVLEFYKDSGIFSAYRKDLHTYKSNYRYTESNVGVAAAITALGRIKLYEDISSVLAHGGKVAYCDTDSIFAEFDDSPVGNYHGGVY